MTIYFKNTERLHEDRTVPSPPTVFDPFSGCGSISTGLRTAGLDRDFYVIAGAQTRSSVVRTGGISDFSSIMNADSRDPFHKQNKQYKE